MGVISALAVYLLLGLVHTLAGVYLFALVFAFASGSWCALFTPFSNDTAALHNTRPGKLIIIFIFVRGIAALVGPYIAAALYRKTEHEARFGTKGFAALLLFVGTCSAVLPILALAAHVVRQRYKATLHRSTM